MRFALADIKKTISRRGGEPLLMPYLLRPGERRRELDALIAFFEGWRGAPRAQFPEDRPSELIGDYRLARCLAQCLSEWYIWRLPQWPGAIPPAEAAALCSRGIASPTHLRLALYDYVNEKACGFLTAAARDVTLDGFAATCGVTRVSLDTLLSLDGDGQATLERTADAPPSAGELAARYNQRAVETVLANASVVEWIVPVSAAAGASGGRGTLVKRVCFLARRMGIQYDVAFETAQNAAETATATADTAAETATRGLSYGAKAAETAIGEPHTALRVAERRSLYAVPHAAAPALDGAQSLDGTDAPLAITLYGPQEVTGAANQYGDRLSRLCTALLGYRRSPEAIGNAALDVADLHGAARVYVYGRPMTFQLNDRLLKLLQPDQEADLFQDGPTQSGSEEFDSSLERRLYEEFTALERAGEAHGWRLEREPEPVLVGDTIMVPDFALVRGARRVFLEIAGYWRPEYRERKARKLAALRGRVALVLAVPQSAEVDFASLTADWPVIWYKHFVSARAVLPLLDRSYNDIKQRLATLNLASVTKEVARRGAIPPTESLALLHCYTRNELAQALERLGAQAAGQSDTVPLWIDGVGLCAPSWRDDMLQRIRERVDAAPDQRIPLADLAMALSQRGTVITAQAVEALSGAAGLSIVRTSIFGVEVAATGGVPEPAADAPPHAREHISQRRAQPRKPAIRKTRDANWNTPSIFAAEQTNDDQPVPDTPTRAQP